MLQVNTTLQKLEINRKQFNENTSKQILKFIWETGSVIGEEGANALSDALIINTTLQHIALKSKEQKTAHLRDISKVIFLFFFFFSDGGIGSDGAVTLCAALEVNTSVREINIYSKFITLLCFQCILKLVFRKMMILGSKEQLLWVNYSRPTQRSQQLLLIV